MGKHSVFTRAWLDRHFAAVDADGVYIAHQPIYGVGHSACESLHPRRHARTFQMLRSLARIDGRSVLDVGGAEGFFAHLARSVVGYEEVVSADLSIVAAQRAAGLFGLPSLALTSHALPFADDAFDVVVCSEVLEHVEFPIETLAELSRVARLAVILTTEECFLDRHAIEAQIFRRCGFPHFERNIFHPDDLRALFAGAEECTMWSQMVGDALPDEALVSAERVCAWIRESTQGVEMVAGGVGVHLVAHFDLEAKLATPRVRDEDILSGIVRRHVEPGAALLEPRAAHEGVLARAVCPQTKSRLVRRGEDLVAEQSGRHYPIRGGVADLVVGMADGDRDPTTDECRERFAAAFGAGSVDVALALRERLALPLDLTRGEWQFGKVADRRGWFPYTGLVPAPSRPDAAGSEISGSTDAWGFRSTSETPQLISPGIGRPAADIVAFTVSMRLHNPDYPVDAGVGQLFWLTDQDEAFGPERHHIFRVLNDGELHTYRIETQGIEAWPRDPSAEIVCLRIDPVNGPCAIELVSFGIEMRPL